MNEWLQKEYVLRIISIVLAVMLWFVVNEPTFSFMPEEDATRIQDVYVEAEYDASQYELVTMNNKVELVLSGNQYTLEHLLPTYRVFVDLTNLEAGTHVVPVQIQGLPAGVTAQAKPEQVEVQLAKKQQKKFEVEVDIQGDPPQGYQIGTPQIDPATVWVKGIQAQVRQIQKVKAVISAESLAQSSSQKVLLQAYGEKEKPIQGVEISPKEVTVDTPISIPSRKVPVKIPISKGPPSGYKLETMEIQPKQVTVFGQTSYLSQLTSYQGPSIDLSNVTGEKVFQLSLSPHGQAVKLEPQSVKVYVKMVPVESNQKSNQNQNKSMTEPTKSNELKKINKTLSIKIIGRREDMETEIQYPQDQKLTVTLEGTTEDLQKINQGDLQAFVDVSGLAEGIHRIPIQVHISGNVRLVRKSVQEAVVKLKKTEEDVVDNYNPEPDPDSEPPPEPESSDKDQNNQEQSEQTPEDSQTESVLFRNVSRPNSDEG